MDATSFYPAKSVFTEQDFYAFLYLSVMLTWCENGSKWQINETFNTNHYQALADSVTLLNTSRHSEYYKP